jgi:hypothetical protein
LARKSDTKKLQIACQKSFFTAYLLNHQISFRSQGDFDVNQYKIISMVAFIAYSSGKY